MICAREQCGMRLERLRCVFSIILHSVNILLSFSSSWLDDSYIFRFSLKLFSEVTVAGGHHLEMRPINWIIRMFSLLITRSIVSWLENRVLWQAKYWQVAMAMEIDNINHQGSLWVIDHEKHEVKRYDKDGDNRGIVVPGAHGEGPNLNQLNLTTYFDAQSIFHIKNGSNNCMIKWMKGAEEGRHSCSWWKRRGWRLFTSISPSRVCVDGWMWPCLYGRLVEPLSDVLREGSKTKEHSCRKSTHKSVVMTSRFIFRWSWTSLCYWQRKSWDSTFFLCVDFVSFLPLPAVVVL